VRLDTPVSDPDARERLEGRLSVETEPAVRGAWRWMHDKELHWRPAEFWPTGTQVSVEADLDRLPLPAGCGARARARPSSRSATPSSAPSTSPRTP
jgi:hypothetical protein